HPAPPVAADANRPAPARFDPCPESGPGSPPAVPARRRAGDLRPRTESTRAPAPAGPAPGGPPGRPRSPVAGRFARPPRSGRTPHRPSGPAPPPAADSPCRGPCSCRGRLLPDGTNAVQFPLDRPQPTIELLGDLLVGIAFHLQQGDRPQPGVGQPVEELPV